MCVCVHISSNMYYIIDTDLLFKGIISKQGNLITNRYILILVRYTPVQYRNLKNQTIGLRDIFDIDIAK